MSAKKNSKSLQQIFIYQIVCKDNSIKENYIGKTISFEQRKCAHCVLSKKSDSKIYKTIRKHGGWNNWDMRIIGDYHCKNECEARQIEQKYIEIFKTTMNSVRAHSKSFFDEELDRKLSFELNNYNDRILGCYLYDYLDLEVYCETKQTEYKDNKSVYKCNDCDKVLSTKQTLTNHSSICKEKKNKHLNDVVEKDKLIVKLNTKLKIYKEQLLQKDNQIKSLQDDLYKMANKAIQQRTYSQSTSSFPVTKGVNKKFL
jgi:hypothetical protein